MSHSLSAHDDNDGFERIDRYQTLTPGTYWRLTKPVTATMEFGRFEPRMYELKTLDIVLLLINTRMFDGAPHTVELLDHPRSGGRSINLVLVNDFLDAFVPAPDGEEVRQREMQAIHQRVADLQQELVSAQTNPALIEAYVEKEMQVRAQRDPDLAASAGTQLTVSRGNVSPETFISSRMGVDVAAALQSTAKRFHAVADIKTKWLKEKTEKITNTLGELAPFFEEKAQVALASTRGARDYADELMQSLRSLDLYVGNGVTVEPLADGASAPAGEPLAIAQRKLFVDEEFSAWADVGSQFDFRKLEDFDQALASNPSLVNQIFPTSRCVVSMAVRRTDVRYGDNIDTLEQHRRNQQNRCVFLLVRDGARIFRVLSDEPSHENARRTFPTQNEIGQLFRGLDGKTITFSDLRFTGRSAAADNIALAYKRLLILLCGLDHREQLFGRFYPEEEALSFISIEFQNRHLRFIADDDEALLLSGGKSLTPVYTWMEEKNRYLRSGSRVMCLWHHLTTKEVAPALHHGIVEVSKSEGRSGQRIGYRDGSEVCVDMEASRPYARGGKPNTFNAKLMLTRAGTGYDCGYLCLDAVTAAEIGPYIYSRRDRIHHVGYIRVFKEALAFLKGEEAQQGPAMGYMRDAARSAGLLEIFSGAELESALQDAVRTWRASRRGEALPSVDDKAALTPILDLVYRAANSVNLAQRIEQHAKAYGLTLLRSALSGANKVIMYCTPTDAERAPYTRQFGWVKRYALTVKKTKLSVTSEKWVWLQQGVNDAAEKILSDYPELVAWMHEHPEPCTVKALESAIEAVRQWPDVFRSRISYAIEHNGWAEQDFAELWNDFREQAFRTKGKVTQARWNIPVGTYWNDEGLLQIHARLDAESWIYRFASAGQRAYLKANYADRHAKETVGLNKLRSTPRVRYLVSPFVADAGEHVFPHNSGAPTRELGEAFRHFLSARYDDGPEVWPFKSLDDQSDVRRTRTVQFELGTDAILETLLRDPAGDRAVLTPYAMIGNNGAITQLFEVPVTAALTRDGVTRESLRELTKWVFQPDQDNG
ncbi:hypothetical protein IQ289_31195 [Burkholderia sp. R-70006]|uniref:hypothetical protein n=1 Tax=Paraburkholderia domus TaxID=2793075 RepID=UPI001912A39A|nr:hypothetical protein [Paraburkholderia domus]MBK5052850.1 hypothetical protein [Burkholderia sp. R-70006]